MLKSRAALLSAFVIAALPFHASVTAATAQNFTKQVTIIVPYAPGGTSDILARLIGAETVGGDRTAGDRGEQADRRPAISARISSPRRPGDGHTLLITDAGTLATQPNLVKKLSFDVQKDLVPVAHGDVLALSVRGASVGSGGELAGAHRL